jgi:hypothetical protein
MENGLLLLDYNISGPLQELIIPEPAPMPCCTADLWQHTCCELFVRRAVSRGYTEWNFSPSGNWWACVFAGYRKPSPRQPQNLQPVHSFTTRQPDLLALTAIIVCADTAQIRLGPAVILEHTGGTRSHWAMAHPGSTPDFHDAETCALIL